MRKYSKAVIGVPPRFRGVTLETFDWKENAGVLSAVERFERRELQLLGLYGRPGVGKTHIAISLYRESIYGAISNALFLEVSELFNMVKSGYGENRNVLEELRVYPLLIIDDLMSGNCSATDMEIIAEIIKERYISKKQLLVTTNLLPNELERALGYHELSRLFGMGSWVEVKGEDRRMDV